MATYNLTREQAVRFEQAERLLFEPRCAMPDLTMEQRTSFLSSVQFDFTDCPDEAAAYIVWLQDAVDE